MTVKVVCGKCKTPAVIGIKSTYCKKCGAPPIDTVWWDVKEKRELTVKESADLPSLER